MNVILLILSIFFVFPANGTKIRKLVNFLEKDAPKDIEKVPNYNEESVAFQRNKNFDPCAENPNLCSNGGKCQSENGNFFCVCPLTHYGKICEHIADPTNCQQHLCQNNSTCVSVEDKKTLVNTVLLAQLRNSKGANEQLTDAELAQLDVEVQYECICQRGTFGVFCDESEADRTCQEVYCLGRGKGKAAADGTCSCQCEKQFFGERCEQLSACFDTQCANGGICEDVVDWNAKTVTASCTCPVKVQIIDGSVSGENCETVNIPPNTNKELIPCEDVRNSDEFFTNLITKIDLADFGDLEELEYIQKDYHDGRITDGRMTNGWCENEGKCFTQVIRLKSNHSYLVPGCECTDPLSEGLYCEYKKKDSCSLSRKEVARGARSDEKCTDLRHGICIDVKGQPKCACKPDYVGEKCEVFDPCARHPCKHGDCIPIPSSADMSFGTKRFQCLCPLSSKLNPLNDCIGINEKSCTPGICNNGRCVPCEENDDQDMMPLCNQNEKRQGFKCLCEAGFLEPTCKVHTNPCHQNLCQNSAKCQVNQQKSYDCICLNGTRGSLCETIDDYCDAFGNTVCEHGICINDEYFHRGFSCECDENHQGLNCDVPLDQMTSMMRKAQKWYRVTLPLTACALSLLILLIVVVAGRRRGKKKETKTEKPQANP